MRAIMQTAAGRTEVRAIVPRPVQVFLAFSAAVTILELLALAEIFRWLQETLVPFTGWVGAMPYMFALAAWPAFLRGRRDAPDVKARGTYLRAQCVTLAIATAFGIVDFFLFSGLQESSNPWLRYSPLRPLWTVVTPTAWCVVLWRERGKIRAAQEHH